MAGHSRPKDGVLSHTDVPAIHDFSAKDVDAWHKAGHDEGEDPASGYNAKLVPQPQEAFACGFFTLNEAPFRSSTKSISDPAM
jgi:hypothetical protein